MYDVDSLHVEIDNLNGHVVGFFFIRDIDKNNKVASDKSEHKRYYNGEKQGIGFILSLVATPNYINIIETHDIFSKNVQENITQRSFFCDQKRTRIF